jgi:hypothetical protein
MAGPSVPLIRAPRPPPRRSSGSKIPNQQESI